MSIIVTFLTVKARVSVFFPLVLNSNKLFYSNKEKQTKLVLADKMITISIHFRKDSTNKRLTFLLHHSFI